MSWPGRTAFAPATTTCASILPDATAMPSGRPVSWAISFVSPPTFAPSGSTGALILSSNTVPKPGLTASRYSWEGYVPSWSMRL